MKDIGSKLMIAMMAIALLTLSLVVQGKSSVNEFIIQAENYD